MVSGECLLNIGYCSKTLSPNPRFLKYTPFGVPYLVMKNPGLDVLHVGEHHLQASRTLALSAYASSTLLIYWGISGVPYFYAVNGVF